VLFFFSGHGAKDKVNDGDSIVNDQSIVVNNDTRYGFSILSGMANWWQWFSNFPTSRIIFIFDSCLSGGMSVLKAPGRIVNMACSPTAILMKVSSWGGGHGQFTY